MYNYIKYVRIHLSTVVSFSTDSYLWQQPVPLISSKLFHLQILQSVVLLYGLRVKLVRKNIKTSTQTYI